MARCFRSLLCQSLGQYDTSFRLSPFHSTCLWANPASTLKHGECALTDLAVKNKSEKVSDVNTNDHTLYCLIVAPILFAFL